VRALFSSAKDAERGSTNSDDKRVRSMSPSGKKGEREEENLLKPFRERASSCIVGETQGHRGERRSKGGEGKGERRRASLISDRRINPLERNRSFVGGESLKGRNLHRRERHILPDFERRCSLSRDTMLRSDRKRRERCSLRKRLEAVSQSAVRVGKERRKRKEEKGLSCAKGRGGG